ncbi:MAG: hypothetical protein M3022_07640 [Actinomycetota bacterium]|nr:hypothetical protein [Actinomycetota bacterium]
MQQATAGRAFKPGRVHERSHIERHQRVVTDPLLGDAPLAVGVNRATHLHRAKRSDAAALGVPGEIEDGIC